MSKSAMKTARIRFNYRDYLLLPEDKRYEILDGDLRMVPAPGTKHQRIGLRLKTALFQHLAGKEIGCLFDAPCDVVLSDEDVVQPDIFFIRKEHSDIIGEKNIRGAPDLVIEVLSPGTRERDLDVKRKIYGTFGVREYWIVDLEASTVEVLLWSEGGYSSSGIYRGSDRLSSPLLPDLGLAVSQIFAE